MAYIRRIQIDDYRSIKQLDVDLSPVEAHKFRHLILTGPNGSGKTSALELIHPALLRSVDTQHPCALSLDDPAPIDPRRQIHAYFPAQRGLRTEEVAGPVKLNWQQILASPASAAKIAQYIVNRRVEQSFARDDGDHAAANAVEAWFAALRDNLAHLLEDPGLTIQFDRKAFAVRLRYSDGREVTFAELAQGHSAALSIFFALLLQSQARREMFGTLPEQLSGVVLIDEIETHLHIRLQEQVLPFLTATFPTFQFVVATHSPAVIASVPDAVVYDLGKREAVPSGDFQGVRYGTLMTHHFGIAADMDHDSTEKLRRLRELAARPRTDEEEARLAALADELSERSATLKLEVWKALHRAPLSPRGAA
jgi:ABC-type cobalamin/Fe3+-siderophores transport system ATPase subunit